MTVRLLKQSDIDSVYAFWKENGLYLYSYEEEKKQLLNMLIISPTLLFVLEEDGKIKGSVLGGYNGRTVYIYRLVVSSEIRKRGFGSTLLKQLEKEAHQLGIKKIDGKIHVSNSEVLTFYEKQGYQKDDIITVTKKI